jgi:hypothetical protein
MEFKAKEPVVCTILAPGCPGEKHLGLAAVAGNWDGCGIQSIDAWSLSIAQEQGEQKECQGTMSIDPPYQCLLAGHLEKFLTKPGIEHLVEGLPVPLVGPETEQGQGKDF